MNTENRRRFTKAEREEVWKKYDGHCAYCGMPINIEDMQVDHMNSLYGHGGTNDMENLMPACRSCNHYKSTYNLERFRSQLERIPGVLARDKSTFRLAEKYGLIQRTPRPVVFYFETIEGNKRDAQIREIQGVIMRAYEETAGILKKGPPVYLDFCWMNVLKNRAMTASETLKALGAPLE